MRLPVWKRPMGDLNQIIRRGSLGLGVSAWLLYARMVGAHPHRPEENVPPHIHEVTGRQVFEGPWVLPLAILTMLVVFVGLPCLVIWGGMKVIRLLSRQRNGPTSARTGDEVEPGN